MYHKIIKYLTILFLTILATSCNSATSKDPTVTLLPSEVNSLQKQSLIGKWAVNHGRFGNAVFDFQENGTLTIENVDTGQAQSMSYIFVDGDTIALSGYEEFDGTADINVSGNEMDFTITFSGDVFGEIYPSFTRIEGAN